MSDIATLERIRNEAADALDAAELALACAIRRAERDDYVLRDYGESDVRIHGDGR